MQALWKLYIFILYTLKTSKQASFNKAAPVSLNCVGWIVYKTYCYKRFDIAKYYVTAVSICRQNKASLVWITNEEENNFITNMTKYDGIWIGLSKHGKKFRWVDKQSSQYRNWMLYRPDGSGRCVKMITSGTWLDYLCFDTLQFICKKKIEKVDNSILHLAISATVPTVLFIIVVVAVAFLGKESKLERDYVRKILEKEEEELERNFQKRNGAVELNTANGIITKENNKKIFKEPKKEQDDIFFLYSESGIQRNVPADDEEHHRMRDFNYTTGIVMNDFVQISIV